jgi:hypothetical protein
MEFNWILVLGVIWFVMNLLSGLRRKTQPPPDQQPREPIRPTPLPSSVDATQQEGNRLELMLREFQRALEGGRAVGHPDEPPLLGHEEVEERQSLEVEPEVGSLEEEVHREVRQRVDQDDEAEQFEARRIRAAAARDVARLKVDHAEFDKRVRELPQQPADHTATRAYTTKQLRDAVVWREILDPPVSMRDDERERVRSER